MGLTDELRAEIRRNLERDIDYVLDWVCQSYFTDIAEIRNGLFEVFFDEAAPLGVRNNAAGALQMMAARTGFEKLADRLNRFRQDPTQHEGLRSAALCLYAVYAPSKR
jgi:hypothetical protein